jgi:histidine triad (HIT) family protein
MENCIFCKIVKGEIPCIKIWEDEKYLAFLDVNPIKEGHALLIPKKHDAYIFDLNDSEYHEIMSVAKIIAKKLKGAFNSPKVGIVVEGFGVEHIHIHLVPVFKSAELDPNNATPTGIDELRKIADKILK